MRLLTKSEYNDIEDLLKSYNTYKNTNTKIEGAINDIIQFFKKDELYNVFIDLFYFNRQNYKNRYPSNRIMFKYLSSLLHVQEPTLYIIRKDIVYKSAMIFYKYGIL